MIPEAVHRSPGIYLIAEKNPGKLRLGDRRWPVIVSNRVSYLQMRSVESYSKSGRKGGGGEHISNCNTLKLRNSQRTLSLWYEYDAPGGFLNQNYTKLTRSLLSWESITISPPNLMIRQIRFSRETFEPGLGFEPWISRSLAWRS